MGFLDFITGKEIKTFEQAQEEAMRIGRENDLTDEQTAITLKRILRKNKISMPENTQNKARGGMAKKAQMMRGGIANGKQHMYAAGGSVTENPGLKALKASGPKGMKAYNKIMGK